LSYFPKKIFVTPYLYAIYTSFILQFWIVVHIYYVQSSTINILGDKLRSSQPYYFSFICSFTDKTTLRFCKAIIKLYHYTLIIVVCGYQNVSKQHQNLTTAKSEVLFRYRNRTAAISEASFR